MGLKSFFFGSKKEGASTAEQENARGTQYGFGNLAGADFIGTDNQGVPKFDWSKTFQPKSVNESAGQYSGFKPIDQAINKFSKGPKLFSQTYNPYQFNFEGLPDQYFQNQYDLGAKDIRREGAGQFQQMNEALGPRNKGLLFKNASKYQRDNLERLAGLRAGLGQTALEQKAQLGKEQQLAQAGEGYKGYQSRSDLEKANADNAYRYIQGLGDTGKTKLAGQMDASKMDWDKQKALLDSMLDSWKSQYSTRRGMPQGGGGALSGMLSAGISKI